MSEPKEPFREKELIIESDRYRLVGGGKCTTSGWDICKGSS